MAEEYESNSNKSKSIDQDKRPRLESMVSGSVTRRKKGRLRQLWDFFAGEDSNDLRSYILAISDIVCNVNDAINLLSGQPVATRRSDLPAGHVAYRKYYRDDDRGQTVKARKPYYTYDDVIFQTLGDAEVVKERMVEILRQYDVVRVADYLELSGEKTEYTDYKYGWTDLSDMRTVRLRDGGYTLQMPRATPI